MINRHQTLATKPLSEAGEATPTMVNRNLTFQLPTNTTWLAVSTPARATQVLPVVTGRKLAGITEKKASTPQSVLAHLKTTRCGPTAALHIEHEALPYFDKQREHNPFARSSKDVHSLHHKLRH